MNTSPSEAVRAWFATLGDCCARVDYAAARAIFSEAVVSFGTKADIASGLDALQRNQWEGVWPRTANFRFNLGSVQAGGTAEIAWGVATWNSTGFEEDGRPFDRPGRATVVLKRERDRWVAVHTHFSLNPGTPPRTFGSGNVPAKS